MKTNLVGLQIRSSLEVVSKFWALIVVEKAVFFVVFMFVFKFS